MGLFSGSSNGAADPELVALFLRTDGADKYAMKALGRLSAAIRAELKPGEIPKGVTWANATSVADVLAVITDRRVFGVKKGSTAWSYPFEDIRDTKLFSHANGSMHVGLFKHSFYLDYAPTDSRRYLDTETLVFQTPREANQAIALIDPYLAS